jgi:glycosyltransferase involved in cell wall biosynthesis
MKIAHVTQDDSNGGASMAAYRLHQGMLARGLDSTFFVKYKSRTTADVVEANLQLNLRQKIRRKWLNKKNLAFELVNSGDNPHLLYSIYSPYDRLHEELAGFDVINFHWISGFIDLPSLFKGLSSQQKVVWTLHDTAAITGACHHFNHCSEYTKECGSCYQLDAEEKVGISHQSWLRKKSFYQSLSEDQLSFVTPSQWLKDCASASSLTKNITTYHIPNGINPEEFRPLDIDLRQSKKCLGISEGKIVLLMIQKGEQELYKALETLDSRNRFLVLEMGAPTRKIHNLVKTINLGNITNLELKRLIYNIADIFVLPSPIDNYPNTLLESFGCATPALASAVGGIPEIVKDQERGWLYDFSSHNGLLQKLEALSDLKDQFCSLGQKGRQWVVENTTVELQAERYHSLYQELLRS